MTPENTQALFEAAALMLGVVIALFTVFSQLSKGITNLIVAYRVRKNRKHLRNLLIVPSMEEMSKYSHKSHQNLREEELEYQGFVRQQESRAALLAKSAQDGRILTIAFVFFVAFAIFAVRIGFIALGR